MRPERGRASGWRAHLGVAAAVLAVGAVVLAPGIASRLAAPAGPPASGAAPADPEGFLAGDAACPAAQETVVGGPATEDALAELRAETRGLPGFAGEQVSDDDRTVVLLWRAPVPEPVRDLAGPRPDGVRVEVAATAYSESDVASALSVVGNALAGSDAPWTAVAGCADSSGVRVEVADGPTDTARLGADLSAVAGMPVTVVVPGEAG